jgi:hypothetical protein
LRFARRHKPLRRSTASRRIVIIPAERWIHARRRDLVWVSVASARGAAKATPVSDRDRVVISCRAKERRAETYPMVGFQTADDAGAEQAAQLDPRHHPA